VATEATGQRVSADFSRFTHDAAIIAHPLPWKASARETGEAMIRALPWRVRDANGVTVSLCASAMVASILARAGGAA